MFQKIEVKNNYRYYKSTSLIPNEIYYSTNIRLNDLQKRAYNAIAAMDIENKFVWLLPYENWIYRIFNNCIDDIIDYELNSHISNKLKAYFYNTFPSIKFREWQEKFLLKLLWHLEYHTTFNIGLIAGLGAGKTLIGLCVSLLGNTIIFAPRHLHSTWQEQAKKFNIPCPKICTYESCVKQDRNKYNNVILDEVQMLKNPESQRHKYLQKFCEDKKIVIGLTGTPTGAKKALDWRWLRVIKNGCIPKEEKIFYHLFGVNPHLKEITPDNRVYVVDGWNEKQITRLISYIVDVVNIDDIMKDVPPLQYEKLYTEKSNMYNIILTGAMTSESKMKAITQARTLSDGFIYDDNEKEIWYDTNKINLVHEMIKTSAEPTVIFASWTATINKLAEVLKEYNPSIVSGASENTSEEVSKFIEEKTNIIIINSRISTGMNLQRSHRIIFVSNSLNPIDRMQAEARCYRPGQKYNVVCYDIISKGTLDFVLLQALKNYANESEKYIEELLASEIKKSLKGELNND